ncbi:MAG: hypothetical protein WCS84_11240, partial [Nocardioides sp.]
MSQLVSVRRSLASSAVCATVALVACGVGAAPASAEPGNGGASQAAPGHTKDKGNQGHGQGHQGQGHQGNNGNGHGNGHQGGQGNQGGGQGGVPSSGQDNAHA